MRRDVPLLPARQSTSRRIVGPATRVRPGGPSGYEKEPRPKARLFFDLVTPAGFEPAPLP